MGTERQAEGRKWKGGMTAMAAVILLLAGITAFYACSVKREYENGIMRIAGYMYEKDEEAAGEMMQWLFEGGQTGDVRTGRKAMESLGYTGAGADILYGQSGIRAVSVGILCVQGGLAAAGLWLLLRMKRNREILREQEQKINMLSEQLESREIRFGEKERMTQNFIENVAHQIKTPLSCITISMDRLLEEAFGHQEQPGSVREEADGLSDRTMKQSAKELVRQSLHYAGEIDNLLKRLLDIGRLEAGRVIWHKEVFRVTDLLADCAEELEGITGCTQSGAVAQNEESGRQNDRTAVFGRIRITGDPEAEYYGDYEWMKEAFSNLLKNALEHDVSGKETDVALRQSREGIKVTVSDRGPGFCEEDLPHIFDRFYLPERMKKSHVGIGLNLARLVIEQHFGSITAKNREGGGAEFTVLLPVYAMKEERI